MRIKHYFDEIKLLIDRFEATHFVLNTLLHFDMRPADQGYINGSISFVNGSILFFKKFLDADDENIDKLMYSYHYQDRDNELIFRYDNAFHKPPMSHQEHKHLPDRVVLFMAPTLEYVLNEIIAKSEWISH